jgi:hypothetical protein
LYYGAQLEQRSSVTAYNATTTTAITNYIPQLLTAPINAPRFDFNPTTGESLGLLIEQSSTNLGLYSQDFTNAAWLKTNTTITATADIAPDGTQTAQLATINATTGVTLVGANAGITSSSIPYTVSVYVKSYGLQYVNVGFYYSSGIYSATQFDITNGTIVRTASATYTNASATITSVGNGWYKCTHTCTVTTATIFHCVNPSNALWTSGEPRQSLTGNGYSGVYIWGAQLEALSFATSYIATTSAQVTRAQDVQYLGSANFTSWFNPAQGTFYGEMDLASLGSIQALCGTNLNDSVATGNIIALRAFSSSQVSMTSNGTQALASASLTVNTSFKLSSVYNVSTKLIGVEANGTTAVTNNTSDYLGLGNRLHIGGYSSSGNIIGSGHIRKIAYYPIAVTSAQLQALTGS